MEATALHDGTAGSTELVSDPLPVFDWRYDAESADSVQPSTTVIEIRPFKGGWLRSLCF